MEFINKMKSVDMKDLTNKYN